MPYKKVNVKEEISKRLENDVELKKAYNDVQHEYMDSSGLEIDIKKSVKRECSKISVRM